MSDQITRLLDQIDRLDQEATPGPWDYENLDTTDPEDTSGRFVIYSHAETDYPHLEEVIGYEDNPGTHYENAVLIALARTFAPAASRALRAVIAHLGQLEVKYADYNAIDHIVHSTTRELRQAITDAMEEAQ